MITSIVQISGSPGVNIARISESTGLMRPRIYDLNKALALCRCTVVPSKTSQNIYLNKGLRLDIFASEELSKAEFSFFVRARSRQRDNMSGLVDFLPGQNLISISKKANVSSHQARPRVSFIVVMKLSRLQ